MKKLSLWIYLGLLLGGVSHSFAQDYKLQLKILKNHYSSFEKQEVNYQEFISVLDSLLKYEKDPMEYCNYKLEKAFLYDSIGFFVESYSELKQAKIKLDSLDFQTEEYRNLYKQVYLQLTTTTWQAGYYDEALQTNFDFMDLYAPLNLAESLQIYSNLGIIRMNTGMMQEARVMYEKALSLMDSVGNEYFFLKYKALNGFAGWFYLEAKYDTALEYLYRLERDYVPYFKLHNRAMFYNNLALIYYSLGNYSLSEKYCEKNMAVIENYRSDLYTASIYMRNLANAYQKQNKIEAAKRMYVQSIEHAKKVNNRRSLFQSYLGLANLYESLGDSTRMYKYRCEGYRLKDLVVSTDYHERNYLLHREFSMRQLKKDNEVIAHKLAYEKMKSSSRRMLLIALAVMIVFLLVLIVSLFVRLWKTFGEYKHFQSEVVEKGELNKREMESKDKELVNYAMMSIQKDHLLSDIKESITAVIPHIKTEADSKELQKIIHSINLYHNPNSWETFRLNFEATHPHFYPNLTKAYPKLTKVELYLSALLALDLTAKEIAAIVGRSDLTVRSNIYRLRKKLSLPAEVKSKDFFAQFLKEE